MRSVTIGDCTLYHADCLDLLKDIPDGSVDAVITDPPYGIALKTNYRERGRGCLAECNDYPLIAGDDKPFDPSPFLAYPVVVLFGANYYADKLPPMSSWFVWDKRDGMNSNDQADCELIWCNTGKAARLFHHRWNGMIKASERDQRRVHPTQKPVALMEWIIKQVTKEGDIILDPFMGSGTTLVACAKLGRRGIGIEINEGYFGIACKRVEEGYAQPGLV